MRAFFNDFVKYGPRPDLGLEGDTLALGAERDHPELATLRPGEEIIVTDKVDLEGEGGELWAEGEAAVVERRGERWWYAQRVPTWHSLEEEPLPAGTVLAEGVA